MDIPITSQTYEGIRGLEADVAELYGIAIQIGDDGRPVRYAYKYPHTVKYPTLRPCLNALVRAKAGHQILGKDFGDTEPLQLSRAI